MPVRHYPPGLLIPPYTTGHTYFAGSDRYLFDPTAASCSTVNAWWLAEASALAYHEFDDIGRRLPRFFTNLLSLGAASAVLQEDWPLHPHGYIASMDSCAIVAFCGTRMDGPATLGRDLLVDFALDLSVPLGGGHVHRGFYQALDRIWPELGPSLDTLAETGQRSFWFTGHSLGAAIASLAAARWRANAPRAVYTYGSPRIGDTKFVDGWDHAVPVHRFVHNRDLVALLPPTLPLPWLNYADLGPNPVCFGDDGMRVDPMDFRSELIKLILELPSKSLGFLVELIQNVIYGQMIAVSDWHRFVEIISANSVTVLTDHAPIYYIDYFKGQIERV